MSNVLVTGGRGFIGQYVCEELVERGHEPVVFDRRGGACEYELITGSLKYELILGDIRDDVSVTDAVAHVDAVIHLAGVLGTQETIQNPRPAAITNVLGGLNVLEACAQYDVPLVNIAVGNYFENNTYAITKHTVERMLQMYVKERRLNGCSVRALNAYGPRQVAAAPYGPSKVRKIGPSFICRALAGEPIEVYGDGEQIMDMVHVSDVARVLVAAIDGIPGKTYEAGTGRRTTVNEIAKAVIAEVGGGEIVHLPLRPGETPGVEVLGDPTTLGGLGIAPCDLIALEEGMAQTVTWFATASGIALSDRTPA